MSNFTAAAFESLNLDAPIERMAEKVARHVISHLDHALPSSGPRIAVKRHNWGNSYEGKSNK